MDYSNNYIKEPRLSNKQHLNLSEYAWNIIENDMISFDKDIRLSTFLNRIFTNFRSTAKASISLEVIRIQTKIESTLSSIKSSEIKTEIINSIINSQVTNLINLADSYPSFLGKKFNLNKENFAYIFEDQSFNEGKYYTKGISKYLKAIFEEYSILPFIEREAIFYKDIIDSINMHIYNNQIVNITGSDGKPYTVLPYKIVSDKLSMYNYLVCLTSDNGFKNCNNCSFRVSRIRKIEFIGLNHKPNRAEIDFIEKELIKNGPQFLLNDVHSIEVKFTENGIKKYNNMINLRPNYIKIVDHYTYIFECTEMQAEFYFFKFGADAQIIKPESLRKKFIQGYKDALNSY